MAWEVRNEKDKAEAQAKMEAWTKVSKLCEEAAQVLASVNEGPMEQAQLQWLEDKGRTQSNLWNVGGE